MTTVFIVGFLIFVNALFVAAEFSSVAVRKPRIEALAEEGNGAARVLLKYIDDAHGMQRLVSASQIGITASSLFLGAFGENSMSEMLVPMLEQAGGMARPAAVPLATTIVLVVLTMLQVVFGELVPKSVSMRYPEQLALVLIYPFNAFMRTFAWLIDVIFRTGRIFLTLLQVPTHYQRHVHSPEELELLIIQGRETGSLADEEHRRLRRVLRFAERRVREVMVPRTRTRTLPKDASPQAALEAMAGSPYTRLPVYDGTLDDIVGIIHVKDVAIALANHEPVQLDRLLRPVPSVPPAMPVDEVLSVMRAQRAQMAIVLDEYGGTAGLVTMEDLVEEVLGEVQDEFDREAPSYVEVAPHEALVRGDFSLADLSERMEAEIEDEDVHTVGGLIMKLLGRPPAALERVELGGYAFEVEEVRGNRVQRVRVLYRAPEEASGEPSGEAEDEGHAS